MKYTKLVMFFCSFFLFGCGASTDSGEEEISMEEAQKRIEETLTHVYDSIAVAGGIDAVTEFDVKALNIEKMSSKGQIEYQLDWFKPMRVDLQQKKSENPDSPEIEGMLFRMGKVVDSLQSAYNVAEGGDFIGYRFDVDVTIIDKTTGQKQKQNVPSMIYKNFKMPQRLDYIDYVLGKE